MNDAVNFSVRDAIGVIVLNNPPHNVLSPDVVEGLERAVSQFEAANELTALIVCGNGAGFVAGGDLTTFDDPTFSPAPFNETLARIERQRRPVICALHGSTLGGGLELAMACHYRVAHPDTRLGQPEVLLGIPPGSLGTVRLPRLIGLKPALQMMLTGKPISAKEALERGLVDRIDKGDSLQAGLNYARDLLDKGAAVRPTRERVVLAAPVPSGFFDDCLAELGTRKPVSRAARAIVRCVEASVSLPFEEAAKVEAQFFDECRRSPESRALRHLFFAERAAAKGAGTPSGKPPRAVQKVGVLGAGVMGTGIAICLLEAGIPVILVESQEHALRAGVERIRSTWQNKIDRGLLPAAVSSERMELLDATLEDVALESCDLVIEAVFEDLAIKRSVLERLGRILRPGAILATNTSTLDVDDLAEASGRPRDVVGMHFFSPANVMRLLEIVRGRETSPDVLASVMQLAKRIRKTTVVSGVCYGFIGNRMAEVYMRENELLQLEGAPPAQIDAAIQSSEQVGMAMGPCRMLDMAGIDVGARTVIEWRKSGKGPSDPNYRSLCRTLFERGRYGQKTGAGYYRYEGRTPLPDDETVHIARELAQAQGIAQREHISDSEIVERLLFSMINEGARILEEGIAWRASDIDVVWVAGYGFPDYRGGPMFMADEIGLAYVVERLTAFGQRFGNEHGHWTVAPLLKKLAREGGRLSKWHS